MNNKFLKIILVIIVVSSLIFISDLHIKIINSVNNLIIDQRVNKFLNKMTLEEKIGQMLIISYSLPSYDASLKNTITNVKPGGFILFQNNVISYEQLTEFISDMQQDSNIPMFITIDQEGGRVQRIKNIDVPVSIIPSMAKLGATKDKELAYQVGKVIGSELNVFGINMDNAPVMDILSNPSNTVIGDRSFGVSANIVSKMGLSLAKGLREEKIIPVYKHFPGHGDTKEDSHYTLPILNRTKEELSNLELKPFINAINNGAEVIMIGHIALPEITGDNTPASLSKVIINDLLRKELGFKGIIMTDALNMKALSNYTEEEILIKAINTGVDVLLMPNNPSQAILSIKIAISNKKITEIQINDAVKRILTLKYKAGLFDKQQLNDKSVLNCPDNQTIINKISTYQ